MLGIIHKTSVKAGMAPGALVLVGTPKAEQTKIYILDYEEERWEEREVQTVDECTPYKDTPTITWIDVNGLNQVDLIDSIGKAFDLHSLTVEDILNTDIRPKVEIFDGYIYVSLKLLYFKEDTYTLEYDQVGVVLKDNVVITFQEWAGAVFAPIRKRIIETRWRARRLGADYLTYAVIDTIVDSYFGVLEAIGERIEGLEEDIINSPDRETMHNIHRLKQIVPIVRKVVWPLRDMVATLMRDDTPRFLDATKIYLRDVYDHVYQVIDSVESSREMLGGMLETYHSILSNRVNDVMKVLTIIATIFIPLTFIAGIYGMNFKYIPELDWHWGYFGALGIMALVALVMIIFFKRKGWL